MKLRVNDCAIDCTVAKKSNIGLAGVIVGTCGNCDVAVVVDGEFNKSLELIVRLLSIVDTLLKLSDKSCFGVSVDNGSVVTDVGA